MVFEGAAGGADYTKIRLFLKNQQKQSWNFKKEQQKFCEYING